MSPIVDLRSDTVTRPTEAMRRAMASAPLGDDVLGDDPTVQKLEETAAALAGQEAALFAPSGTMTNQIALAVHCGRGDALLCDMDAHIVFYEVGAPAVLANAVTITLPSIRGVMDPEMVRSRVMRRNLHTPGTVLLCLENTHNRAGGSCLPAEAFSAYRSICDQHSMRLHMDGARLFNAAVAQGVSVGSLASPCDSVSLCLSKGLGSPVGSVLCASRAFIEEARRWRKRLGGGMRQSGLLAACGLVALEQNIARLAEDHARARRVAEELNQIAGVSVDLDTVQTNMVVVSVDDEARWMKALADEGIWVLPPGPGKLRLVFHYDVDDQGVERTLGAFRRVAGSASGSNA